LIPDHYKEITLRIYCRRPELVAKVQCGFRELLRRINESIDLENELEAESSQLKNAYHQDVKETPKKFQLIDDSENNPFLNSPKRMTSGPYKSPVKLEINETLLIRDEGSPKGASIDPEKSIKKRKNLPC
jgi:hypothetical protein